MDNVINFLLDYYVWILIILGIIIITIIGFLVDSKQKRKKNELGQQGSSLSEVKTVEPLPEASIQEAVPVVDAKTQQIPSSVDNVISAVDNNMNPNIVANTTQQVQPIQQQVVQPTQMPENNVVNKPVVNQEISLSEQKPHFEPKEVPMPNQASFNNGSGLVTPQPINAVSINQPMPQQNNIVQTPQQVQNLQQLSPVNVPVQNMATSNNMQQPMQSIPNNQIIASNGSAYNSINNVQQPVAYQNVSVPVQTPVVQQQSAIAVPSTPMVSSVQNMQPVNNSGVQPQTIATNPNIGISFVTGDSGMNNADDDTWKL